MVELRDRKGSALMDHIHQAAQALNILIRRNGQLPGLSLPSDCDKAVLRDHDPDIFVFGAGTVIGKHGLCHPAVFRALIGRDRRHDDPGPGPVSPDHQLLSCQLPFVLFHHCELLQKQFIIIILAHKQR